MVCVKRRSCQRIDSLSNWLLFRYLPNLNYFGHRWFSLNKNLYCSMFAGEMNQPRSAQPPTDAPNLFAFNPFTQWVLRPLLAIVLAKPCLQFPCRF